MAKRKKKKKKVTDKVQKKFRYYAIKQGIDGIRNIIVTDWKECYDLTDRHTLEYKTFTTEKQAEEYLMLNQTEIIEQVNQVELIEQIKPKKTINIFLAGGCDSLNTKDGYYIGIMQYKSVKKTLHRTIENTTANRVLIQGLIDMISTLKEPCIIELYVACPLGFKGMKTKTGMYKETPSGTHKDLLKILRDIMINDNHEVNEHITSQYVNYLKSLYKKIIKEQESE